MPASQRGPARDGVRQTGQLAGHHRAGAAREQRRCLAVPEPFAQRLEQRVGLGRVPRTADRADQQAAHRGGEIRKPGQQLVGVDAQSDGGADGVQLEGVRSVIEAATHVREVAGHAGHPQRDLLGPGALGEQPGQQCVELGRTAEPQGGLDERAGACGVREPIDVGEQPRRREGHAGQPE